MIRLEMKNCNMINRETAKISALSSGKIHKYEYITGEDALNNYEAKKELDKIKEIEKM